MLDFLFGALMSFLRPMDRLCCAIFTRHPESKPQDDPTYKANVQRLIERNREFEK